MSNDICYIADCGRPASMSINIHATAAASAGTLMKPVCNLHSPYIFAKGPGYLNRLFAAEIRAMTPEQFETYVAQLHHWREHDKYPHG